MSSPIVVSAIRQFPGPEALGDVAQGPLSGLAALPPRRARGGRLDVPANRIPCEAKPSLPNNRNCSKKPRRSAKGAHLHATPLILARKNLGIRPVNPYGRQPRTCAGKLEGDSWVEGQQVAGDTCPAFQ